MERKSLWVVLGFFFFILIGGMFPFKMASAEQFEINWVSFIPQQDPVVDGVLRGFVNRVTQNSKGEIVFKYRGGPETIPGPDQVKAVQKGVVDMSVNLVGFVEPLAPGVGGAMLTQISLDEERKSGGGYDFLNELYKKAGLFYLGRSNPSDEFFYLALNKKIEKPQDFVGKRIGTAPAARACTEAWGATPVTLNLPEYYSAMERGLVDGISSCSLSTWVALGCYEVTKYIVEPGYYQATGTVFMNLDKWNRLPKHLQTVMIESIIQSEKDNQSWTLETNKKAREKIVKAGVNFYKLSPEVTKWFIETAYNAAWDYQQKRFPEVTPKLRGFLSKK